MFDGHLIKENGKDTLLHLPSVLRTKDDHLLFGKVDGNRCSGGHSDGISIGGKGACIVDDIVRVKMLQLLRSRADEHVSHKQGMIRPGAYDSNIDSIMLIPSGISIHDVDAVPGVQVINSSLSIDSPDLKVFPCQSMRTISPSMQGGMARDQKGLRTPSLPPRGGVV